jgi:hypothetical protein
MAVAGVAIAKLASLAVSPAVGKPLSSERAGKLIARSNARVPEATVDRRSDIMGCDITVKRSTIAELAFSVIAPTLGATLRTQCTTKLAAKRERDVASICGSSRGCASDDEGQDCQQCGAAVHQCTHGELSEQVPVGDMPTQNTTENTTSGANPQA